MTYSEDAAKVVETLQAAEREPGPTALPMLNALVGLVQGDPDQPLEIAEARSGAFIAICELGKALHRGQPVDGLWGSAIDAAERWRRLAQGR